MSPRHTTAAVTAALLVATTWLTTACGGPGSDDDTGSDAAPGDDRTTAGPSTTEPLSASPPPTRPRPAGPPPAPTDRLRPRTVTGTVTEVAGCTVLDAGGVRWALRGDLAGLAPGAVVTVTGRATGEVDDACGDAILHIGTVDAG